jgi:hypothetical protein
MQMQATTFALSIRMCSWCIYSYSNNENDDGDDDKLYI